MEGKKKGPYLSRYHSHVLVVVRITTDTRNSWYRALNARQGSNNGSNGIIVCYNYFVPIPSSHSRNFGHAVFVNFNFIIIIIIITTAAASGGGGGGG